MSDIQELREIVNPVFNTAKSCVQLDAAAGDEDAQQLLTALGFEPFGAQLSNKPIPQELFERVRRLFPAYMILVESRFRIVNRLIEQCPDRIVVDLPCGYTSRGIHCAKQNRTYYGFDLPAVIDDISPAVEGIIGKRENIHYRAVDATNRASMEAPLENSKGKLLITTEGLLHYFTQSELEEVFHNIHALLQKHGGSWVTVDRAVYEHDYEIVDAALEHDEQLMGMYKAVTNKAAGTTADIQMNSNVFFDPDVDKVKAFIRDMGFELKAIPMSDYLPEHLGALKSAPQAEAGVKEVFKNVFLWEMRAVKDGRRAEYHHSVEKFSIDAAVETSVLHISLTGRLDTLTAPDLLALYQKARAEEAKGIEIDLQQLDYISSAGLRVLLIMFKECRDNFRIKNIKPAVQEIFATTGFDSMFGV